MNIKRTITATIVILAIGAIATTAILRNSQTAHAQDQSPSVTDRIQYGMSGLPTGHTMRVYVTSLVQPTTPDLPPGPSRVVINFRNAAGDLFRDSRSGDVIRRVVMLDSGESAFFDLDADALPPGPIRFHVRPVITVQYALGVTPPDGTNEHKPMVTSVEIFNNSNPRAFIVIGSSPGVIRGFNPQPDPPSPGE